MGGVDAAIIVAVIAMVQAIGVAIITGIITRNKDDAADYRKKREKKEEADEARRLKRENLRVERDAAMLALLLANVSGTEVLLKKAHGEKVNGDVDLAISEIERSKKELNKITNREVSKL